MDPGGWWECRMEQRRACRVAGGLTGRDHLQSLNFLRSVNFLRSRRRTTTTPSLAAATPQSPWGWSAPREAKSGTPKPKPQTLYPKPQTQNPQPHTLHPNPKPHTLNPKPSTRWLDLEASFGADFYLPRVKWLPDNTLIVQVR